MRLLHLNSDTRYISINADLVETERNASGDPGLILIDYQPKGEHRNPPSEHGFLEAAEMYSYEESTLLAAKVASQRHNHPGTPIALWSIAKPAMTYPAYTSREDAAERFLHAALLLSTTGADTLVLNLNIDGVHTRGPQNEYARVTQAINWARAALPHIHIIPSVSLNEDLEGFDNTVTAWAQACHDCAVDEVLIWSDPTPPEVLEAFQAGIE